MTSPSAYSEDGILGVSVRWEAAPRTRRLNPIRQKQMEDRRAFLEEEVPRVESAIAHTEEQLGIYELLRSDGATSRKLSRPARSILSRFFARLRL